MEDFPNVLIIPENDESPEEIIADYCEMILYNVENNISLDEVLYDFFDDVNRWTAKQLLIDQAKQSLQELENIHKEETQFIELDDDEEY